MTLSQAWAVDGGRTPAAVGRMVAWCATNGASGVVLPGDMRVAALSTPGAAVSIGPGGAVIASTYSTAGKSETYAMSNNAAVQLTVPANNTSSARTDYIILRVDDTNITGATPPADPLNAPYCAFQRVTSISGLNYPFISLAKINMPAMTGVVNPSQITDLRNVANPRTETHVIGRPVVTGDTGLSLTTNLPGGEVFPNVGNTAIDIPKWATRMQIFGNWNSVRFSKGNSWGQFWMEYGPNVDVHNWTYATQKTGFDSTSATDNTYQFWSMMDDVAVPTAIRGTNQPFIFKAGYDTASTNKGVLMTPLSAVWGQVIFLERADQDTDPLNV